MSLFDQIGGMLGGQGGAGGLGAIGGLMESHGGLGGLVSAFQANGMGGVVNSWISNGENAPISAEQITQVLGSGPIAEFAQKLGINPQDAAAHLSELLPQVVNHLTPNGEVPGDGAPGGGDVMGALTGLLNKFK